VSRRRDDAAMSEVVGALMLVLIVTSAASAFAVFTNKQRERTEGQKQLEQSRALEKLLILSVEPTVDAAEAEWTKLSFTVLSQHVKDSEIVGLEVGGFPLQQVHLKRADSTTELVDFGTTPPGTAKVQARERFQLLIDLAADAAAPIHVPVDASLTLRIGSSRLNTFERAFLPPMAIGLVDVKTVAAGGSGYRNYAILDASQSDVADPSTKIIKWEWSIVYQRSVPGVGTTMASDLITSTAGFLAADVGRSVAGSGIPAATTILAVADANNAQLSQAASATATVAATLSTYSRSIVGVGTTAVSDLLTSAAGFLPSDVGKSIAGPRIPSGTTIVAFTDPSNVRMSQKATATDTVGVTIAAPPTLGRFVKAFECPSDFSTVESTATYSIGLKATDNFGLFSKDTIRPASYSC
jgi:hypothetical protein